MNLRYPAVLWELGPDDEGWDKGRRYRVDMMDGDQFFFIEEQRAREFIEIHGMTQLDPKEMEELRRYVNRDRPASSNTEKD